MAHKVLHTGYKGWQNGAAKFDLVVQVPDLKQNQILARSIWINGVLHGATVSIFREGAHAIEIAQVGAQGHGPLVEYAVFLCVLLDHLPQSFAGKTASVRFLFAQ